jgi:hypothetical protein
MERSTKEQWLQGSGDLVEAEVEDVPVKGSSVKVRALSARWSAAVQAQLRIEPDGTQQVARLDVPRMELLQFVHGCIEPTFSEAEAELIQEKYGAAFRKVIGKLDEISGLDKASVENAEIRFPAGGETTEGQLEVDGPTGNGSGSAVPTRTGA